MRDDLLDAQAAVDWAVAQIPRLQSAFLEWQRGYPYRIVQEKDPEGGNDLAVAYQKTPLPRELSPWVGAIINSVRSSLDLLAAALQEFSPEALAISLEEAEFSWREILGVSPSADAAAVRRAMTRLALRYHSDEGGRPEQMTRINAAYETARRGPSARR